MGKRRQQRYALSIQLIVGQDDDLIQWAQQLDKGTRQQQAKNTLRVALDMPIPAPPMPLEIEALRNGILAELHAYSDGNGNSGAPVERLQQLEAWMHQMATAYNEVVRRLDHLGSLPAAAITSPDPVESAPQISQEQQTNRTAKLKKASW